MYNTQKELIPINIELKPQSKLKETLHKIQNKSEDILFSVIEKLPEKFIPSTLLSWSDRYMTKRINELQQQIVHDRWKSVELEKVRPLRAYIQQCCAGMVNPFCIALYFYLFLFHRYFLREFL